MSARHRYECSQGHAVSVPGSLPRPKACPVFVLGQPCTGRLDLIGPYSKRAHELFDGTCYVGARVPT